MEHGPFVDDSVRWPEGIAIGKANPGTPPSFSLRASISRPLWFLPCETWMWSQPIPGSAGWNMVYGLFTGCTHHIVNWFVVASAVTCEDTMSLDSQDLSLALWKLDTWMILDSAIESEHIKGLVGQLSEISQRLEASAWYKYELGKALLTILPPNSRNLLLLR